MNKHLKCVLKTVGAFLFLLLIPLYIVCKVVMVLLRPVLYLSDCFDKYEYPDDKLDDMLANFTNFYRDL